MNYSKSSASLPNKRKLVDVEEPFQDTPHETPTQVDNYYGEYDEGSDSEPEKEGNEHNTEPFEEDDEQSSEDDEDNDDDEEYLRDPRKAAVTGRAATGKRKKAPRSVAFSNRKTKFIELIDSESEEKEIGEEEEEEENQLPAKTLSSSSSKEIYTFQFREEKFNNSIEDKGGYLNDLKAMYSSFLKTKQLVHKGNKTQHPFIYNLESLVLLLANEKMVTEDGVLNAKEKPDVIIVNCKLVLETLPVDPFW